MAIRSGTAQYGTFDEEYYLPVTPLEPVHRWYDSGAEAATKYAIADDAKHELELYKAATIADLKKVTDFDNNPANWALTPEQRGMLDAAGRTLTTCEMASAESKWCEEPPAEDNVDQIYDIVGGRPNQEPAPNGAPQVHVIVERHSVSASCARMCSARKSLQIRAYRGNARFPVYFSDAGIGFATLPLGARVSPPAPHGGEITTC